MASKRPTTIAEYIGAAPREGQPHLRRLYAILKSVAPEAKEAINWLSLDSGATWNSFSRGRAGRRYLTVRRRDLAVATQFDKVTDSC